MAENEILKVYTAEQLYNIFRDKLLSDSVGLTDFNSGSKIRALLEALSELISSISMDEKEALFKSIPIALYEGFDFKQKAATQALGSLRPYRKPALWIKYTGAGASAKITTTLTNISSAVTGAPTDAFNLAYSTYPTLATLVAAIDALTNWEAYLILDGSIQSSTIFIYNSKEVIGSTNYINTTGLDLTLSSAIEITVPSGFSVSINQQTFITTADGTIAEGETGVQIPAQATISGLDGNLIASAIDTLNGKGYINSSIDGVEQVINDSAFSGGAAEESSDKRKTRFSATVNSLNAGTKNGIIVAIQAIDGIRSVGMRTASPFKGTNTIVVDDGSGAISPELLAEVEKVLYGDADDLTNFPGKNAEGIGYNIVAPGIIPVDIGISATRLPSVRVELDEIKTDIQTAIEQYVNTRALGENVLVSEIIRIGKNSNAAVYDLIVNSPTSNIVIDEDQFAKTGSGTGGTVTVVVSVSTTI